MKKILLIAILLLATLGIKAQQGEIIYVDFEPDFLVELKDIDHYPESRMNIDCDFDSLSDIRIYQYTTSTGCWFEMKSYNPEWEIHEYEAGDTLVPMDDPGHWWSTGIFWMPYFYHDIDTMSDRFAVRHKVGDSYYYGWFRVYITGRSSSLYPWAALDKIAYCTIPDYPLVWGETDVLGIENNDVSTPFASIHPNPTSGMVTITGENLRQAEVINAIGQQVLSVQGKGNELSIDMAALPAGVYFVAVTDEEGRKCVRKVVRE